MSPQQSNLSLSESLNQERKRTYLVNEVSCKQMVRGGVLGPRVMISYRLNQSDTERAGGLVSRILTNERTSLKDDILQALVLISFNMPSVQHRSTYIQ